MAPVLGQTSPEAFTHIFQAPDAASLAPAFQAWLKLDAGMHRFTYQRLREWAPYLSERQHGCPHEGSMVRKTCHDRLPPR